MNQNQMVESLRAEIAKLQRVLDLLLDQPSAPEQVRRPGRPMGSTNRATSFNQEEFTPKKRTMSAEGKARIAAAQKMRWAAQKGSASRGTAPKKVAATKLASKASSPKAASKVVPAETSRSTGAGKGTTSTKGKAGPASTRAVAARKNAAKKSAIKKMERPVTRKSAKQAASTEPALQTA